MSDPSTLLAWGKNLIGDERFDELVGGKERYDELVEALDQSGLTFNVKPFAETHPADMTTEEWIAGAGKTVLDWNPITGGIKAAIDLKSNIDYYNR